MGFHKHHQVGRAFHGEEARDAMAMHRRDSHGDHIVMHVPLDHAAENDVQTAVSVVYVTLAQTFDGPASLATLTGGYTSAAAAATNSPAAITADTSSAAPTSTGLSPAESSYLAIQSAAQAISTNTASTGILAATTSLVSSVAMATATNAGPHSVGSSSSQSSAAVVQQSTGSSGGMSGAAKAGLAIAIIVALGMAVGLIFFCWRRKRNPSGQEEIIDEKHTSFADASARSYEARHAQNVNAAKNMPAMSEKVSPSVRAARTTSTAPRLSLRPGSSFLPMLGGGNSQQNNNSAWDRRPSNTNNARDPFGDTAPLNEKSRPVSPPTNPFDEPQRQTPKTSYEATEPNTPQSTKFGTAAAVAVAGGAAGAAQPPRGPSNVHRVQLDFKPSMEDELELRSGQLVRMLHEYDDGWALCIRMDRSQQGVAPRTCLSKLPVKPRPQGPPGNSRPGTSHSMESRPSMQSQRSYSPPQASRGPSPVDQGNVPNRKPVPGQAM